MEFLKRKIGNLEFEQSSLLLPVHHGFSTRLGGCSTGYLASMNLGFHRGDDPENVQENYRILGRGLGFDPLHTVFTKQVHETTVDLVTADNRGEGLLRPVPYGRDALICNTPDVVLTIFYADCTPILFYDPVQGAIGAAHAGWRGTAGKIGAKTVLSMQKEFGCDPKNIRAAIGPCISHCCFETHSEVPEAMLSSYGSAAEAAITGTGPKYHVDLKALNRMSLEEVGLTQIDVSPDCTVCQPDRYWSHRATQGNRGVMAAVLWLEAAE